jgi:nucleotide-binding universal stress UspA family protein
MASETSSATTSSEPLPDDRQTGAAPAALSPTPEAPPEAPGTEAPAAEAPPAGIPLPEAPAVAPEEKTEIGGTEASKGFDRVFLVVVDNTPELPVALRYACRRALHTGGRVALVHVIEPADFQHWLGVGALIEQETRQAAEQLIQKMAAEVYQLSGAIPVVYIREGERTAEVLKLLQEEPGISILVLAAATGGKGPGPLVTALTGKMIGQMRVPITVVPGNLTADSLDKIA